MDEFLDQLLGLLRDDNPDIVVHAVRALRNHDEPAVVEALLAVLETAPEGALDEVVGALTGRPAWSGPEGRRELLRTLLARSRPAVRLRALDELGDALGPEDAPVVRTLLEDEQVPAVVGAALSLLDARFAGLELGPLVARHLDSVEAPVRAAALDAFRMVGGVPDVARLEGLLDDPSPRVRAAVIRLLWAVDPERMKGLVLKDLGSPDVQRQQCALGLMAELTPFPEAPLLLSERLADPNVAVRSVAARGLRGMAGRFDVRAVVERYLDESDGDVRRVIGEMLGADEASRRESLERLIAVVREPSRGPERRARAARGLADVGRADSVPYVAEACSDSEPRVRANAVEGLSRCNAEAVTELLARLLADESPRVCANAALELFRLGSALALPRLVDMLRSADPRHQACAAFALGEMGTQEAAAPLRDAYQELSSKIVTTEDQEYVRDNVVKALEKIREGGEGP